MALTGLQIQKLLPKTNCKECGSNTCLAFAMKLAAKTAALSECPYASDETKAVLGAASEPPVKAVTIGTTVKATVGEETVMYRHEKTFVHQTLIAINIYTDAPDAQKTLADIAAYKLERVGEVLGVNAVAITQRGDANSFAALAAEASRVTELPLILRAADIASLEAAAAAVSGTMSVLTGVTADNVAKAREVADTHGHALAVTAPDVDGVFGITAQLRQDGFDRLFIEFNTLSPAEALQTNIIARRAAISDSVKPMGYPTLRFIDSGSVMEDTVLASTEILKYGGVVVLPSFDAAQLAVLMTLRLNIFTDPQKPIQVEPKIYPIGEPDRNSPVFVTTNFSLTYFLVSGEIENSGISAWLVIPECEGMSVLTAWAAGKFSGAIIAKFIKEAALESLTDCRNIVIPGLVSQISGELEENLPGYQILVGPQEAADLESYIKSVLNA